MRMPALCLLLAAFLGVSCDAPARAPEAWTGASTGLIPGTEGAGPGAADILPVPHGFPSDGTPVELAFARHAEREWVLGQGTVERLLRDDTKRPRHQRFVVRVGERHTVLVAHNIDLAPRVPLRKGDTIAFRGEYVWNDQGGVVHWTHRDRRDRKAGGWIVWKGQNFR